MVKPPQKAKEQLNIISLAPIANNGNIVQNSLCDQRWARKKNKPSKN